MSQCTAKAIAEGKVHRIHSMYEQKQLIKEVYLTSSFIYPPLPGNAYVCVLRPTLAIIDCPVVAQP